MTQENQAANVAVEIVGSTTLLQFLLILVAGWLELQQVAMIDYLKAENRVLRARLGGQRVIFSDAERRQLAKKVRVPGRKALRELASAARGKGSPVRRPRLGGLLNYYEQAAA